MVVILVGAGSLTEKAIFVVSFWEKIAQNNKNLT
jgi:hypothetical protein